MKKANSLIVSQDGKIGFIGRKFFSYLNLKKKNPFAYPDGALIKGDLIVYIDLDCEKLTWQEEEALSIIGLNVKKVDKKMIHVGIYDNLNIQPIYKCIKNDSIENHKYIETLFDGNSISVSFNQMKSRIEVSLNGQIVTALIGKTSNALFCFDALGLKYFNYSQIGRIEDTIYLFKGESYLGCSIIEDYFGSDINAKDIFTEVFFNVLEEAKQVESFVISTYNGDNFYIINNRIKMPDKEYNYYYIEGKQDILENMDSETSYYRNLVKEDNKSSNNILSSSFRLRGQDPALLKIKSLLQKACATGVTILLTGESGTGKTFMANEIHKNSKRSKAAFIHVNCAAIPYQLIESELFGHEEGAFTGAKKGGKKGYFEMAQNGTIFLDEITETPLALQGKLLEVIQNNTFYRVGGSEKIKVDVRLIAATNRNLKQLVLSKEFREDLYYRINVFPVELPPLRSRNKALYEIINDVLPEICEHLEIEPLIVSGQALQKMKHYSWPGNIRELENVLAKAAIMCDGKVIMPEDIEFQEQETSCSESITGTLGKQKEFYESKIILDALKRCNGEKMRTAEYLGISRTNLFEKIRKYGLDDKTEE